MQNLPRIVPLALATLCVVLAIVIGGEFSFSVADVGASPNYAAQVTEPSATPAPTADSDALVAAILERPLFSASRRPPAPPEPEAAPDDDDADKTPELTSRLAGVMIRPDEREALFAGAGEKPIAVQVGGQIDGWTVSAIEPDHVELTSAGGTRSVEPTKGARTDLAVVRPPAAAKPAAAKPQAQKPPPTPVAARNGVAAAVNPPTGNRPPVPAPAANKAKKSVKP